MPFGSKNNNTNMHSTARHYYLKNFSRGQRIHLIGAFAMAMSVGPFSGPAYDTLAEVTIRGAISFVTLSFSENNRTNPIKNEDDELGRLLSRQFRAFRNNDPHTSPIENHPSLRLPRVVKE